MRNLAVAVLVGLSTLTVGASRASAAPIPLSSFTVIGQFSWDDPFGTGPTFTFENLSGGTLSGFSLELETLEGPASFSFLTPTDDPFVSSQIIPSGGMSWIPDDLSLFHIDQAFIRAAGLDLFLLDPLATELLPLVDENGVRRGLNGLDLVSAQVAMVAPPPPSPVPEPGTLMLVGLGLGGVLLRSKRT